MGARHEESVLFSLFHLHELEEVHRFDHRASSEARTNPKVWGEQALEAPALVPLEVSLYERPPRNRWFLPAIVTAGLLLGACVVAVILLVLLRDAESGLEDAVDPKGGSRVEQAAVIPTVPLPPHPAPPPPAVVESRVKYTPPAAAVPAESAAKPVVRKVKKRSSKARRRARRRRLARARARRRLRARRRARRRRAKRRTPAPQPVAKPPPKRAPSIDELLNGG